MYSTKTKLTCRDLRRSNLDLVLNTLLLALIALSYIPQLLLLLRRRSTHGISSGYLLSGYLFTASQFSMTLLYASYGYRAMSCVADKKLVGTDAWAAILGVALNTIMWLGSAIIISTYLFIELSGRTGPPQLSANSGTTTTLSHRRFPKTILFLCLIHFAVWVLPVLFMTLPRPYEDPNDWTPSIFVGFCGQILMPAALLLVVLQFPPQIKAIISAKHTGLESSLSLVSLALQCIAFILLGVSWAAWLDRLHGRVGWDLAGLSLWGRYRLGGWQYMNPFIFGIGQGILFVLALWFRTIKSSGKAGFSDLAERAPLLQT